MAQNGDLASAIAGVLLLSTVVIGGAGAKKSDGGVDVVEFRMEKLNYVWSKAAAEQQQFSVAAAISREEPEKQATLAEDDIRLRKRLEKLQVYSSRIFYKLLSLIYRHL